MLDYVLIVISGLTVFAQATLGLLVTTRPPSTKRRIYYEVGFIVLGLIGLTAAVWGGVRAANSSDALNNNLSGIKTSLPAAVSQKVVQSETNAHLETYLYIQSFTASGSAAVTVIATNPGNAPIEISRIEAFTGIMSDTENDVGFDRVLQPESSISKFFLVPKALNGPPALTVEFLYKGVEQGKSENLLNICRFDVNKTSPLNVAIYPMDCQESPGNNFIQPQEKAVTFNIADPSEGAMEFVFPEISPNGSPNVVIIPTASKLLVFNPIKDFAVFVCADDLGKPKVLTEKFNENPFGNHDHLVRIEWNDKTGEVSLYVDGKTKTVY